MPVSSLFIRPRHARYSINIFEDLLFNKIVYHMNTYFTEMTDIDLRICSLSLNDYTDYRDQLLLALFPSWSTYAPMHICLITLTLPHSSALGHFITNIPCRDWEVCARHVFLQRRSWGCVCQWGPRDDPLPKGRNIWPQARHERHHCRTSGMVWCDCWISSQIVISDVVVVFYCFSFFCFGSFNYLRQ